MILGIYNIQESQKVGTGRDFKIIRSKPLTLQMRKATQSEEAEVEFQSWGGRGRGDGQGVAGGPDLTGMVSAVT